MSLVDTAISEGRCALAVSGALLQNEQVMLALRERAALQPMGMSGALQAPCGPVGDAGMLRAVGQPKGVIVMVDPGPADQASVDAIAKICAGAPHKPTVVVVARKFNAFAMQMAFRGCKLVHEKDKGQVYLSKLPMPPADLPTVELAAPTAKERKKAKQGTQPALNMVGREEELASLTAVLGEGGPVVVSGPRGVGRSWLVEHAIVAAELTRLPNLDFDRGVGADALFARLAEIARAGGSDALVTALKAGDKTPAELVEIAITSLQAASGTEGQVMVLDGLEYVAGRQADFFRKSRLELLLEALLTNTYPLRLVFLSTKQPVFYREGRDAPLRRVRVEGVKGRFFFDIFQAYHAPEVPRERFGPLYEKLHGHPLAVRMTAVAVVKQGEKALDNAKFLKMSGLDDEDTLRKYFTRRLDKLPAPAREALSRLAQLPQPVDGAELAEMGIGRKDRIFLLSEGLLDMFGTAEARTYRVHSLVRRAFPYKEVSDFRWMGTLGNVAVRKSEKAEGVEKLAQVQIANRMYAGSRLLRSMLPTELPDHDAVLESCFGLMRSKTNPRFDMAEARVAEVLKANPRNADAHLVKLELLRRTDAKNDVVIAALTEALDQAPVPEVFHEAVSFYLARKKRGEAVSVLERGVAALPDVSRLRTRLASLMLREGRRPEAIEQLQKAMELDPMLPDAYGLLGMARREEGAERLDDAESLLREAVRLAPNDVVQVSRLVALLLDIARGVPERAEAARKEIRELLDALLLEDKGSAEAHLLYAQALREEGGDTERARYFFKKAIKLSGRHSRNSRYTLEGALLDLADGKVDEAERTLKGAKKREPWNDRLCAAMAKVLEAKGQLVAAHAELLSAVERTSPHSLNRAVYELEQKRLQAAIEAQFAGGGAPAAPAAAEEGAAPVAPAAEVVRRSADGSKVAVPAKPVAEAAVQAVTDAAETVQAAVADAAEAAPVAAQAVAAAVAEAVTPTEAPVEAPVEVAAEPAADAAPVEAEAEAEAEADTKEG